MGSGFIGFRVRAEGLGSLLGFSVTPSFYPNVVGYIPD